MKSQLMLVYWKEAKAIETLGLTKFGLLVRRIQVTFSLHSFQMRSRHETSVCVHTIMNTLDIYFFFYLLFLLHASLHSYIPTIMR